jgi:glycosyltransferase involved in cell wall biosynthesis
MRIEMSQPLVSVLMTAFNAEDYIGDAINSILRQTYSNFELIILDDGSVDKSKEVASSFKDSRIKIIINKNNLGLVAARNQLVDLSSGKYIAFLDADDRAFPERLHKQVEFLEGTNISICGSGHYALNQSTGRLKKSKQRNSDEDIRALISVCSPLCNPSVMIRAEVLKKFRYLEGSDGAEDYALWQVLALNGYKFANLPDLLITYRIHGGQITQVNNDRINEIFYGYQKKYLDSLGVPFDIRPRQLIFWKRFLVAPKFIWMLNRKIKNITFDANCQIYARFQFRKNGVWTPFTRLERYLIAILASLYLRSGLKN